MTPQTVSSWKKRIADLEAEIGRLERAIRAKKARIGRRAVPSSVDHCQTIVA